MSNQTNSTVRSSQMQTLDSPVVLLAMPALRQVVGGVSRTTIYELIASGGFPKPVKIGHNSRWIASEVYAWVHAKANAR